MRFIHAPREGSVGPFDLGYAQVTARTAYANDENAMQVLQYFDVPEDYQSRFPEPEPIQIIRNFVEGSMGNKGIVRVDEAREIEHQGRVGFLYRAMNANGEGFHIKAYFDGYTVIMTGLVGTRGYPRTEDTDAYLHSFTFEALQSFETWAKEFAAAPHRDVLLSDAKTWFANHFESDIANGLAAEYLASSKNVDGLPKFLEEAKAEGKTEVLVSRASAAIDMNANGLQNAALQRMKMTTPLFTLRMVEPGRESGSTLWSFVYSEGTFRFVGKMTALNPTRGDLVTDALCQMPLGPTEKFLKEKGLIETSAVEYLRSKGVLK